MFKYTKHTLKKIEALLECQGYKVRYEKGTFQSGYCLVENRKIAVINRFFDTEGRINTLIDILGSIEVDEQLFEGPAQLKFYKELLKPKEEQEAEEREQAEAEPEETPTR